jgi:hypothetical protein
LEGVARLNAKQFNIANGPQGTRWADGLIKSDERWADQTERSLGREYLHDVTRTHIAAEEGRTADTPYYPGRGGEGTQVQGKLFHDPKPSDPVRWPRGFTPERQSDVAVTFPTGGARAGRIASRKVGSLAREAIARSDMPERHLSQLSRGFSEDGVTLNALPALDAMTRGGDYWNPQLAERASHRAPEDIGVSGAIRLGQDASANTVLHEVGHAMSWRRRDHDMNAHGEQAPNTGGAMGAEEARADIYANDHARKRDGTRHYDTENYDGALNDFNSHYIAEHVRQGKERPGMIGDRLRLEKQQAELKAAWGPTKPSPHLFQRPEMRATGYEGDPYHIPMPTEPDYGQYGAETPEGKDVGTIPVSGGLPEPIRQSVVRRQRMVERMEKERKAGRSW